VANDSVKLRDKPSQFDFGFSLLYLGADHSLDLRWVRSTQKYPEQIDSFGMARSFQNILVTGGAGFIGSHIVDALIAKGHNVGVLDSLSTGRLSNLKTHLASKKITFHEGDIADFEAVSRIVPGYDAINHEAALVSVTRSVENPLLTNEVNVGGTINLLKAAVDAKARKFVYASSSSVYGDTPTLPKIETMNPSPASPYGVSKLAGENYCRTFAKVYGLHTISLRYFNVYGPRQTYGPYSGVIPIFIQRILDNRPPIVFGDGGQTRDFTYVKDVVQANLRSLESTSVPPGSVFNIGRGKTITINELAAEIEMITGKTNLGIEHGPERLGDIRASFAEIAKAKQELGYMPETDTEEGLRHVVDWLLSEKR